MNILPEVHYIGPAIAGLEKEGKREKESKRESGWGQSLVLTKLLPASTGTVFDFMIYNTAYQFLTRVKSKTYLRTS